MEHLRVIEMPQVGTDLLITALAGWADAGEAATAALKYMMRKSGAKKFAELDPEEFYDFSQVRPYTSLNKQGMRQIRWPSNEMHYSPKGRLGKGVMYFLGVEPSLKWRTYAEAIIGMAHQCGVTTVVHVGALLDAIPHTRDVLMTGSSNDLEFKQGLESYNIRPSRYQGPTGITSAVMEACTKHNISYATVWGHTPHYLQAAPNYSVGQALIKTLSHLVGINVEMGDLEAAADTYRREVSGAVERDSQISAYVGKLEERYDHNEGEPEEMPQPDEVLRDLENFLKNRQRPSG